MPTRGVWSGQFPPLQRCRIGSFDHGKIGRHFLEDSGKAFLKTVEVAQHCINT